MTRHQITDPDVRILAGLAGLAGALRQDYADDLEWEHSPFSWIKQRPSRQVGKIGELLVAGWLATRDFTVGPSPDSEADRLVNGKRVEVKFSTRWKTGVYKFQQLRDQKYDFVVCLGVSPFDAQCWAIPKTEILRRWQARDGIVPQHGGRTGVDTAWLSFQAQDPPAWLAPFGGPLAAAAKSIAQLVGRDPAE